MFERVFQKELGPVSLYVPSWSTIPETTMSNCCTGFARLSLVLGVQIGRLVWSGGLFPKETICLLVGWSPMKAMAHPMYPQPSLVHR